MAERCPYTSVQIHGLPDHKCAPMNQDWATKGAQPLDQLHGRGEDADGGRLGRGSGRLGNLCTFLGVLL